MEYFQMNFTGNQNSENCSFRAVFFFWTLGNSIFVPTRTLFLIDHVSNQTVVVLFVAAVLMHGRSELVQRMAGSLPVP
jgi:hypothetical protein